MSNLVERGRAQHSTAQPYKGIIGRFVFYFRDFVGQSLRASPDKMIQNNYGITYATKWVPDQKHMNLRISVCCYMCDS